MNKSDIQLIIQIFAMTSKIDVASTSSTDVKIADSKNCETTIIKDQWSVKMTKFILNAYEECLPTVGSINSRTKKYVGKYCTKANNFKYKQKPLLNENWYKTVLKRCHQKNNNKKSGAFCQTVQFDDEIRKIASIDDSVIPNV